MFLDITTRHADAAVFSMICFSGQSRATGDRYLNGRGGNSAAEKNFPTDHLKRFV
jgi:hypothetical protein